MDQKDKSKYIDLITLFIKVWGYRWYIVIYTTCVIILTIVYSFIVNEQFNASVKIYKESSDDKQSRLQAFASQFGFGANLGGESAFSIEDLVDSRRINEKILAKKWETTKFDSAVTLITYWEIEKDTKEEIWESGLKTLFEKISFELNDETGLTIITAQMPEPKLAADVANYIPELISEYVKEERKTSTQENINYIGERIKVVKEELAQAEDLLREFRERNRVLSSSPALQLEYGRLQREVTIKQEVYLTLQKEMELAEIELVKETPVINILDHAVPPVKRAKPIRSLNAIIGAFVGLFLSFVSVFIKEVRRNFKKELKNRNQVLKLF